MKNVHVLVIPYPAQGHVIPLMEAARCIANKGVMVTFVNTEASHKRVMNAWSEKDGWSDLMQMVWIPDGVEPWEDVNDYGKLTEAMFRTMPSKLEELIRSINETDDKKVTCVVADYCMGWAVRVAHKLGIRRATFCSGSAAFLALMVSIQKLLDDEVIDNNGEPLKDQMIQLSKTMPPMNPASIPWACIGDSAATKLIFNFVVREAEEASETADWIVCNSSMELETGAFTLFPKLLPIGPLLATNEFAKQAGHFWNEDSTCLTWLDQQPARSVIYVAFGSTTIFDQTQFDELALGLELTNKPFLWVVRCGTENVYPNGYMDRIGSHGKIVSWAPQQAVLSHTSVGCFVSHCGWNSTLEGVSNGVRFLCWPYFGDQFLNTTYVCDIWRSGLGLNKDDNGIVTRGEIKNKVEQLLRNEIVKENALNLQEKVMEGVREGKSSNKNLCNFIDWIREGNANAPEKNT